MKVVYFYLPATPKRILVAISFVYLTMADNVSPILPVPGKVCPCLYKYEPVCGSDGVTYMNKCVLNCTTIQNLRLGLAPIYKVQDSECSGNCNCQKVNLPVCTLDGLTYPNECELACENLKRIANKEPIINLAYRTACLGPPGNCTDIAAPVCGTDNVLYRSKCVLDYASYSRAQRGLSGINLKNNGACLDSCLCPVTTEQLCGSNGEFFNNFCTLECENDKRRSQNGTIILEVDKKICDECVCTDNHDPVCANDGKTYANPCQLNCEILRRQNNDLKVLYNGECPRCKCHNVYVPVCGTDRKTYNNLCWLQCENIGRTQNFINTFHEGECQQFSCDCGYCDDSYQPMCGSDNQTYFNLCWLQCNDRCNRNITGDPVFLSRRGPC